MGEISWNQAANLRAQLRTVQPIAYRVQTGVASHGEYRRLARVVDRIERMTATSYASRRAPPYAYGYGWR
ncbi:hypothetical protein [Phenylobacterium sp.]|uniref:hypothetical protein n=1 Tax=Phenylobacterium sp. TaxID=1871053 RepID=UPI002F95A4E6